VVFIIADDLGYGDLGCYGQTKIKTPNLDRLAAEGLRFTQMYSGNAVCAPSRCVLMTGKDPGRAYIRDNRQWEKARNLSKVGQPEFEGQEPVLDSELLLPELLREVGYTSGGFGKWGLGGPGSSGEPMKQGFDRWFGYNCQAVAHNFYPTYLWDDQKTILLNNPPFSSHDSFRPDENPDDPKAYARFQGNEYASDRIAEEALAFARKHRDRPFFLFWPVTAPHVALQVPDDSLNEYVGQWEDPPYKGGKGYIPHYRPRAAYAAMITRMDREVGRMMALTAELGLDEHTLFAFTSDNGPLHGQLSGTGGADGVFFNSAGGLRDGKGTLYEGGVRVPGIVRWKGAVKPGQVSDRVVGFEDWLPTLAKLAGAADRVPAEANGISFAPTLLGETQPERELLYREFPGYGGQQMIRTGKWKLIKTGLAPRGGKKKATAGSKTELFDLEADRAETMDLSAQHPEIVAKLEALMKAHRTPSPLFPFPALDQ
jgi:arylsulfatase A